MIHHVIPIEVIHLFPVLDAKLTELLRSLSPDEWHKQTIARKWIVKDVAAHLLDGNLRTLSMLRDNYWANRPENINTYKDLVLYLNELNAEWVAACKRLSPGIIIEMLENTGRQYTEYLATVDPWENAPFSVAWAGEEMSTNWFHIAREYTEKWIHQQQIRNAVGRQGLMTKELFYPFINTFMCALPHTYRYVDAPTGTSVEVVVTTDIGGVWHINKTDEGWVLRHFTRLEPNALVEIDPDTAWKLFSKGISPEEALEKVKITGDEDLGKISLGMVSVMA
ncbi:MAG: maleylpyruvate isomerase family protein [Flavipsychrobacter sp.]|jgi:uncharacterized protein (TIGR03083 family)|nr:maleylpyruvate isomerase family protein [Flavipsychrobacter sp.]